MKSLEEQLEATKVDEGDLYQMIQLMALKARIYDMAGVPQKGFSVSLRAASLAYRSRSLPALWYAIGSLGRVLISLKEYQATARLLRSIMPQALECDECSLAAQLYSCLADAHMGMASLASKGSSKRKEQMTKALECFECAFDEYSSIEDVSGQCQMMAKRATIMHLIGDLTLANDYAAKYFDLRKSGNDGGSFGAT